jgi:hypothetical protein
MQLKSIRLLFVSTVSAAILATPALAFDGQDLLNKINAVYKLQGVEFSAESINVDGEDVTFAGAKVIYSEMAESPVALGDISFEGVTAHEGGYKIDAINFDDLDYSEETTRIVASDIAMENVIVPAYASAASIEGMLTYEQASASDLEFYDGETAILTIASLSSNMIRDVANGKLSARFDIEEFELDISDVADPSSKDTLNKLQIELLSGNLNMSGAWNSKSGELDLEELKLAIDNIGTLSASFSLTGYTVQFIEGLQEIAKSQAANSSDPDAAAMAGLSALGLAEELAIKSAVIRFEDESITERLIDFMAEGQSVSSSEFKTMMKSLVPMYVSQLGAPELEQAIVKAVNIYLDDPKNISIMAKPAAPVKTPEIIGTALGNPGDLPKALGITVQAND